MLNCLIVDDEPLARQVLENYIGRDARLNLTGISPNALDAHRVLLENKVDIMFLDIKMPRINGLDFLRSLERPPAVVFTTAFAEHAAESYELNAVDYLLKPFSYERFCKSIEKILKFQPQPEGGIVKEYLFIKADNQLVKILHKDILFIEARKDYLKIVTGGNSLLTHMTMKYISSLLPVEKFVRIHQSYIISLEAIKMVGKGIVRINDAELPVGERYKELLQVALQNIK